MSAAPKLPEAPLEVLEEARRESRARRASKAETFERTLKVAEMMGKGEWVRGKSAVALAAEWGCEVSTVENYSSEASRWVDFLKRETARLRLARAFEAGMSVIEDAIEEEALCQVCSLPCGHSSLEAVSKLPALADKYAALTGANEPTRANVAVAVLTDQPEWVGWRDALVAALKPFPDAMAAVEATFAARALAAKAEDE